MRLAVGAREPTAATRLRQLIVAGPDLFVTYPLPEQGAVEIGRTETAQLRTEDPSASRRHATLHVTPAEVTVEDHGSVNGTYVRGAQIPAARPVAVAPGDAIQIGATILVLQQRATPLRLVRLWPHVYFEARVDDECQRARASGLPFCVMRLLIGDANGGERAAAALESVLDWGDAVAVYAPQQWELLLSARHEESLDAAVEAVATALEEAGLQADPVVAHFPDDGRTADALLARLQERIQRDDSGAPPPDIVVSDPAMVTLYELARRAAPSDLSVLVLGETGSGKDVLARYLHDSSPRADRPYLSLNCAALNETLVESELFGHERGAFTGAVAAKAGLLEAAHGGTVFLDEVGELSPAIQAKLLRVLENRQILRLGSVQPRTIDVRFIAATNRDPEAEVHKGSFRRDLYYRLAGIVLTLPPLRDRRSEIVPLAQRFLAAACRRANRSPVPALSPDAAALLQSYPWPGNLRELKNIIERALVFCAGTEIQTAHLPADKLRPETIAASPHATATPGFDDVDRQRIIDALASCAGNQTRAARLLGMPRRTLLRRLEQFAIARPQKPG